MEGWVRGWGWREGKGVGMELSDCWATNAASLAGEGCFVERSFVTSCHNKAEIMDLFCMANTECLMNTS